MSIQIIQERLNMYPFKTDIEELQAIREMTQEVVLAGLGRGKIHWLRLMRDDFYKKWNRK